MVALVKKRLKIWREIAGVGDFVRGSVVLLRRPCTRPNCRVCRSGRRPLSRARPERSARWRGRSARRCRAILDAAIALSGNGYEGSSRPCASSARQKYMNDRQRRMVSLLGELRFKRAAVSALRCSQGGLELPARPGIMARRKQPAPSGSPPESAVLTSLAALRAHGSP